MVQLFTTSSFLSCYLVVLKKHLLSETTIIIKVVKLFNEHTLNRQPRRHVFISTLNLIYVYNSVVIGVTSGILTLFTSLCDVNTFEVFKGMTLGPAYNCNQNQCFSET